MPSFGGTTSEMREICLSKAEFFFLAAARMARDRVLHQEAECVKNNQTSESDEIVSLSGKLKLAEIRLELEPT